MKIREIIYSEFFCGQYNRLPLFIRKKATQKIDIFRRNPFHPSLHLHKLKGKLEGQWAISVDYSHRIIITPLDDGDVVLQSIGRHAIYDQLP
jgi:Txe/YoeB family toxin of Txe-Axe toxin-antitoxin module